MAKQISNTIVLRVNGKQVENSFNGLRNTVSNLERELRKLTPGTKEFMDKAAELREARSHFERVKNEIKAVNGSLDKSGNIFTNLLGKLSSLGIGFSQIFAVFSVSKITEVGKELLKIADAMTDVQKTTNMALEEVKQLWDEFDNMDTRTSKLDRLKIAEVGGRLGVPKEQMASFVQEIDKAYVALGDSFDGGLEGVVDSLGKIKGLFEDTKAKSYADAINEVGSALNELAANGTASEGNISNFALRVGALPDAIKPSIDKVLGLGAAFEESGIDAQKASSGFTNFMKVAGENLNNFAYSMNMSIEEAKKLFNEKPEEFFLRFAEGMKNIPADETIKIFESLKLNSLEVQTAVGVAANRTDEFREAMKRSAVAMNEANSLTDEFNKKNNNAPAIIEKLKNAWSDFFTKTNILNALEGLIQAIGWLTGVTSEAGDGVKEFKNRVILFGQVVTVATVSLVSYKLALKLIALASKDVTNQTLLSIVAEKASTAAKTIGKGVTLLYAYAKFQLADNTKKAAQAMRIFKAVTQTNPLALFVTILMTAVATLITFREELFGATKEIKKLSEMEKINAQTTAAANKSVSEFKDSVSGLIGVIKSEIATKELRERAYKRLIALYPEFENTVNSEYRAIDRLQQVYDLLIKRIDMKARAEAKAAARQKIYQEIEENNIKIISMQKAVDKEQQKRNEIRERNRKKLERKATRVGDGSSAALSKGASHTEKLVYTKHNEQVALINENHRKEQSIKLWDKQAVLRRKELESIIKNTKSEQARKDAQYELDLMLGLPSSDSPSGGNKIVPDAPKKPTTNRPARDTANDELNNAKSEYQKALELNDKNKKELLELEHKFQDEKFKILEESKQKEWDLELQDFERKKEAIEQENQERLTANKKLQNEIDALSVKKKEIKNPAAKAVIESTIVEKKKQQDHNIELIQKNNELEAAMLETHSYNLMRIEEKWEIKRYQKEAEALQRSADLKIKEAEDEIIKITSFEEAKAKLKNLKHLKLTEQELRGIRTLEDAKKALREDADRAYLKAQEEVLQKQKDKLEELLKDPSLQGEAMEQLNKDLAKLEEQITRIKSAIQGKNEEDDAKASSDRKQRLSNIDLLGFSADQWEDMFKNLKTTEGKIKAVQMATQALSNAFSHFVQLQQNLNDREMQKFSKNQDKKKKALLIQLNHGLISQEEYHKGVQLLEEQTTNKKEELAKKYAKIQKILAVSQITISTAQAIMGIWKDFPKVDFGATAMVMSGVVAALGAAQIATVLAQPDSFAQGGYTGPGYGSPDKTGKRPAGIVHGNEYVTPDWMLENPVIADTVEWMEAIRTGRLALPKGYADGGFVDDAIPRDNKPVEASSLQAIPTLDPKMQLVLMQLKELLEDLNDNGVDAYIVESAENGRKIKRMIKKIEKIENKNARRKL